MSDSELLNSIEKHKIWQAGFDAGFKAGFDEPRDWTLCAEGLPEDDPNFSPMSRYECTILIPDGTRDVFTLQRTENGRWLYETGKGLDVVRGDQVAAWRKMPEPYNPYHIVDANKKMED